MVGWLLSFGPPFEANLILSDPTVKAKMIMDDHFPAIAPRPTSPSRTSHAALPVIWLVAIGSIFKNRIDIDHLRAIESIFTGGVGRGMLVGP
jgi:hypothetical protein